MDRRFFRIAVLAALALTAACASSRTLSGSVNDLEANATLKAVLFADRTFDYSDIDLTIYEGRLMLTGTMHSEDGRKKLVENAWKADGVEQVIDEIFVGDDTSIGQGFEDARIDQQLRAKYLSSGNIRSGNYKIAVSGAVVYLLGVARDQDELDAALAAAQTIGGVEAVVSHVTLRHFSALNN